MDNTGTWRKPRVALMTYAMDNRVAKGTALYARKLVGHLLEDNDFEWYLVHYEMVQDPLYARAREIVMPAPWLPSRFLRQMLFFWKYRHEGFDIIHWFQPRLYPLFWLAPARRLVATLHGAGDITAPAPFVFSKSVFNFVLRHFNRRLNAIIAVSQFAKQEIADAYGAPLERIFVIYNGGGEDFSPIEKHKAQMQVEPYGIRAPFILDVSRLEPHKNVASAIGAYIRARGQADFPHTLLIVGFSGSAAAECRALAERSLYARGISFITFVQEEDLNALYSAADVLLFPSLNEGFGLPVVEAFAAGTPVITSNTSALPEVAGDAAVLVDPLDEETIASAILHLLVDPQARAQLVARGASRAREFTWQKTADATLAVYKKII